MTNKDHYETLLSEYAMAGILWGINNNKPVPCSELDCLQCAIRPSRKNRCPNKRLIWLSQDFKEPSVDWSEVAVDTPVYVRNTLTSPWRRRYFAAFKNNHVYTFSDGATSWSGEQRTTRWDHAELVNEHP